MKHVFIGVNRMNFFELLDRMSVAGSIIVGVFFLFSGISAAVSSITLKEPMMLLVSLPLILFGGVVLTQLIVKFKKKKTNSIYGSQSEKITEKEIKKINDRYAFLFFGVMFLLMGSTFLIATVSVGDVFWSIFSLVFVAVGIVCIAVFVKKRADEIIGGSPYDDVTQTDGDDAEERSVYITPEPFTGDRRKNDHSNGVYSYMNCPHCGALNEVGNHTCRSCGKKL